MATRGPGFEPTARGIAPVAPVPSILTSSRPLPAGLNWRTGVSWRSLGDLTAARRAICNTDAADDPGDITQPQFTPYTLELPYACDWVTEDADYHAEAVAALEARTAWLVARELWLGDTEADNPSLLSEATDASAVAAVHPVTALGMLLEAYENCAQAGGAVVHAPTAAVTSLLSHGVIKQQGDVYYGPNGSIVSPGPGYPTDATNTGPDAADSGAGNVYTYVSGPVEYALTPAAISGTDEEAHHNRRLNRYEVIVRRLAIHRFDPTCVFAVKTYVPSPTAGEAT